MSDLLSLNSATNCTICIVRKLAEDLGLEGGSLAKKCEEFERKNRSVLAESR
jgi:hypothetical protein